jgi:hypothetical protein
VLTDLRLVFSNATTNGTSDPTEIVNNSTLASEFQRNVQDTLSAIVFPDPVGRTPVTRMIQK